MTVVMATSLQTKILARTRGENSIHAVPPDLFLVVEYEGIETTTKVSLQPLTEPPFNLLAGSYLLNSFLFHAREWFSVIFPGRDSQSSISSPWQGLDHILVSVNAF